MPEDCYHDCDNTYLKDVQNVVLEINEERQKQGKPPRLEVECCKDRIGEYLKVTRLIAVDENDVVRVKLTLRVDDLVECKATYSGGAGFALKADDIEIYHAQITRLNQLIPTTRSSHGGWTISIEPHSDRYTNFPPDMEIPLYLYNDYALPTDSNSSFASKFLDTMNNLDRAWLSVYDELASFDYYHNDAEDGGNAEDDDMKDEMNDK